jgi:hypothetical protein
LLALIILRRNKRACKCYYVYMHRVDTKDRQKTVLRIIAYAITFIMTIITTALLIYLAQGYRLGSGGKVVRDGLLLVDNRPESASVYINDKLEDSTAPSRFVLPAGDYKLGLKLKGYRDWSKTVRVDASKVREVGYPLLIPNKLNSEHILSIKTPEMISQSGDRKKILTYSQDSGDIQLIDLNAKNSKAKQLSVGANVVKEDGKLGSFRVIEWALNNKNILLEQTLPSGKVQILSLDVENPTEVINITAIFGEQSPLDVHFVGDNTNQIYGIKDGTLARYDIKAQSLTLVMQNIISYQPYSDDTILFVRNVDDKREIGVYKDHNAYVIESSDHLDVPVNLSYHEYDQHHYFVIANSDDSGAVIYKDPLKKPILKKQLPLVKLKFSNIGKIETSGSGQFIMLQNSNQVSVYDLRDLFNYQNTLPFEILGGSRLGWIDDHRIQAVSTDNSSYIFEYDSANIQLLSAVMPGSKAYFSRDYKTYYSFTQKDNDATFSMTSLIVED